MAAFGLGRPSKPPVGSTRRDRSSAGGGGHPRQSSAAYQLFDTAQMQTFKEAFNMMDQDNDGVISEKDVKGVLDFLGQPSTPSLISSLLSSRPTTGDPSLPRAPSITFPIFITMMAEHLTEMDVETDLVEAFACFDEGDKGYIDGVELKEWLGSVGDRMSEKEIDRLLNGPFTDRNGRFHYKTFCQTLRVSDVEEESEEAKSNLLMVGH